MPRLHLILVQAAFILAVSLLVSLLWILLPQTLFSSDKAKTIFAFVSAITAAGLSTISVHYLRRYIERPVLRIEHVDFKTDRKPFTMEEDLWWHVTHGPLMGFAKDESPRLERALQRNEIQHFHLKDLESIADQAIKRYSATAVWARNLMQKISTFASAPSDPERRKLLESFSPDIIRFDDHYRQAGKGALFEDLIGKPAETSKFMTAEIEGLLAKHERELAFCKTVKDWTRDRMAAGANEPQLVDHARQEVPKIRVFVGVANVGQTPALLRLEASLDYDGHSYPLIEDDISSQLVYSSVAPHAISALSMEVQRGSCSFKDQVEIYQALTDRNQKKTCSIRLNLADGTEIQAKRVALRDNSDLRV